MTPLGRFVNFPELLDFLISDSAASSVLEDIQHDQVNAIEADIWRKRHPDGSTSPYAVLIFCLASKNLNRVPLARATIAPAVQRNIRKDEGNLDLIPRMKDPYNIANHKFDSYKAVLRLQAQKLLQKQLDANKSAQKETLSKLAADYKKLVFNSYAEAIRANGRKTSLHLGEKAILKMLSLNPQIFKEYQELCTQNLIEFRAGLEAQYLKNIDEIELGFKELLKSNTGSELSVEVADGLHAIISKAKNFKGKIPAIIKNVGDQVTAETLVVDREKLVGKFKEWPSRPVEDGGLAYVPEEVQLEPIFEDDTHELRGRNEITEQVTPQIATMVGVPAALLPLYQASAAQAQAQVEASAVPCIEQEFTSSFSPASAIETHTNERDQYMSPAASQNAKVPDKKPELPPPTSHDYNGQRTEPVVNASSSSLYPQNFNRNLHGSISQVSPSAFTNRSGLYKVPVINSAYSNSYPQHPNNRPPLPQFSNHYARFPAPFENTGSSFTPINSPAVQLQASDTTAANYPRSAVKRGFTTINAKTVRTQVPKLMLPHKAFQKSRKTPSLVTSNSWYRLSKTAAVDNTSALVASTQDPGVAAESPSQPESSADISNLQVVPEPVDPVMALDPNTYTDESLYEDPKSPTYSPTREEDPDGRTYPRATSPWIKDDEVENGLDVPPNSQDVPSNSQIKEGDKDALLTLDSDSQLDDFETRGDEPQSVRGGPRESQCLQTLGVRSAISISSDEEAGDGQVEYERQDSDADHHENRRAILAAQKQDKVWATGIMTAKPQILGFAAQEIFLRQFKGKKVAEILAILWAAKTGGAEDGADRD